MQIILTEQEYNELKAGSTCIGAECQKRIRDAALLLATNCFLLGESNLGLVSYQGVPAHAVRAHFQNFLKASGLE